MLDYLRYMFRCSRAYFEPNAGKHPDANGVQYFALTDRNVPYFTCLIGRGRDAWIVTQLALDHQLTALGMARNVHRWKE